MLTFDELPIRQRTPYMRGYQDFMAGAGLDANPYYETENAYFLWDEGWADADNDARQD